MQLTAYSDYSLRVLMHTALCPGRRVTVVEVTNAYRILHNHLVKIVHELGCNGYLETRRGIGEGFTLVRSPEQIGVSDIVRLGEKTEKVIECTARRDGPCRISPVCRLKGVLYEVAGAFSKCSIATRWPTS
jgi:Rrf2 family nitric oxide-sensitive transcriptional repressor